MRLAQILSLERQRRRAADLYRENGGQRVCGHFPFAFSSASGASRSALSRSRLADNAFCAISCSVIACSASTWRNTFRASRSALVIGLGGSNSPGVFVISSPLAPARLAGGWLAYSPPMTLV